jgi:C_GCAxxG_C_C family probable redox protein
VDEIEKSRDAAIARFREQGPSRLNCAQAVVAFMAGALEQDPELVALGNYMGGGSVGMGHMCGALSGAVLALGVRDYLAPAPRPEPSPKNKVLLQQLIRDFEAEFGNVSCLGLTGHDLSTKEGYARFKQEEISERCTDYVGWVCDRLAATLSG